MVEGQTEKKTLHVYNSLTNKKDEFKPVDPYQVTWYICGPTVYDVSHMGHARTYVTFDIIRRILSEHFGYNVMQVMNITDIDDKIIRSSMEQGISFNEFSRKWENEFMTDMKSLGVALPDCITRVSEYVPEIIEYIEKIIENGFAYEANGSVYFATNTFDNDPKHNYAKLEPLSKSNTALLQEGEGVLTQAERPEKRHPSDFALWKKTKEGEPAWPSPWGQGRPGWHIECSAMASSIYQQFPIDIHCGGLDLRFPHHDNELAQSEAYYKCDNWINHFWHTGKLTIEGCKMSKSEKNYITIRDILEHSSARHLRYIFLLHTWNSGVAYSEKSFPEAKAKDKQFASFFRLVKTLIKERPIGAHSLKWVARDFELSKKLNATQKACHEALCDSFDTPTVINELSNLVIATNSYMNENDDIKVPLVRTASRYVFKMLRTFGIYDDNDIPELLGGEGEGVNTEEAITPVMDALAKYRDDIKNIAKDGPSAVFKLSDQLRDDVLPFLGILLEDRKQGEPSKWLFQDKEELIAARAEKIAIKEKAEAEKRARKELETKKLSTPATEWFKTFKSEEYSQFDDQGIPTHQWLKEKKGKGAAQPTEGEAAAPKDKELPEAIRNKLKKEWNTQDKKHKDWLAKQAAAAATPEEEKKQE